MQACQTVLFELIIARIRASCIPLKWGEFTGSGKNGDFEKC